MTEVYKLLSIFFSYQLIALIAHLGVISVVSFFHFLLDHRLSSIEEWAFDNVWNIAVFVKVVAAFIVLKFVLVKSDEPVFKDFLKSLLSFFKVKYFYYVAAVFMLVFMVGTNFKLFNYREADLFLIATSLIGTAVFYGADLLVLYFLRSFYRIRGSIKNIAVLIITLASFFVFTRITFTYTGNVSPFSLVSFLLLTTLLAISKNNFKVVLLFLGAIVCPFAAIGGEDILWGDKYSLLESTGSVTLSSSIIAYLLVSGYLIFKTRGVK